MRIQLTKRFLACVRKLGATDVAAVDDALAGLLASFGRPHTHLGQSVRPLRPPVYELRATLALRIIFVRAGDVLRVDFVGDHRAVANYLKNSR